MIDDLPEAVDRQIVQMLAGTRAETTFMYGGGFEDAFLPRRFILPDSGYLTTLRMICDTGRGPGGRNYVLNGSLRRAEQKVALAEADLLLRGGVAFLNGTVARFDHAGAFDLVGAIRDGMKLTVPGEQGDELLRTLFALPRLPKLDLPEELRVEEITPVPKPRLKVRPPRRKGTGNERLSAEVTFDYAGQVFEANESIVARY